MVVVGVVVTSVLMVPGVLGGVGKERVLAAGGAEVELLAVVVGRVVGGGRIDGHATHRIGDLARHGRLRAVGVRLHDFTIPLGGIISRVLRSGEAGRPCSTSTTSSVDTTVANSPSRFVAVVRASSSAVTTCPSGPVRSKVCVASRAKRTSYPRSPAARAVVSQQ